MSEKYTVDIVKHIGTLAKREKNTLELNIVSWNGREPKFDIREWSADHKTMTRGLTFTREEIDALAQILQDVK